MTERQLPFAADILRPVAISPLDLGAVACIKGTNTNGDDTIPALDNVAAYPVLEAGNDVFSLR